MTVVYRRFGGSVHVRCDSFAQLREAVQIPETQWVATAAPTSAFLADAVFLKHLDGDANGRIRVDELQAATRWLAARLTLDEGVDARSDVLVVSHLAAEFPALRAAATTVLSAVGGDGAATAPTEQPKVSLAQVRAADDALKARGENGDGIVAPQQLPAPLRALGEEIRALFPERINRAGEKGLAPDTLEAFQSARAALLEHLARKPAVWVWGEDSLAHARRIALATETLDAHFLLCRLVASQPDARERLRLAADRIETLVGDRAGLEKALAALPICPPDPAGVITFATLHRGPAYELVSSLAKEVLAPILGHADQLQEQAWRTLVAQADAILAWQATFEASPVKGLVDRLAMLDDDVAAIAAAQANDLARQPALQAIADLEKLILLQRSLLDFANSFLSMRDIYTNQRALFERGWGVLGGRRYEMSVVVPDLNAHTAVTSNGTTCILYGKVEDHVGGSFEVAMPKTRGWSTELQPGKRGVFYDLRGVEYDLTVTHVVRHPVSVLEAALTPFLRIGELIKTKLHALDDDVEAVIHAQTRAVSARIDGARTAITTPTPQGQAPPPAAAPPSTSTDAPATTTGGGMSNALAMGGLAVAAVGSSVAFIANQLKALTLSDVISIIALGFLAVALPSGFVGWLKLRRRNLAELLEGSGWALNDRLRLTPNLTARITQTPSRVAGSQLEFLATPAAPGEPEERHAGQKLLAVVVILLVVLWQLRAPLAKAGCRTGRLPTLICALADETTPTPPKSPTPPTTSSP